MPSRPSPDFHEIRGLEDQGSGTTLRRNISRVGANDDNQITARSRDAAAGNSTGFGPVQGRLSWGGLHVG
jgi:hypothetical protein